MRMMSDESILRIGRISRVTYLPGILCILLAFYAGSFARAFPQGSNEFVGLAIAGALLALFGVISLARAWYARFTTKIIVTNRRVIHKTGLIWRKTVEMNMSKIETVMINQSILGRLLNYGTIAIRVSGAGLEGLQLVSAPLALREAINAT